MDLNHTEVIIVLDRSGSMVSIKSDMEGGLDQFFAEQKKEPGRCTVTLAQFDDKYEVVYSGRDLKDVPKAFLDPRGMTALLDAVGKTINEVGSRLAKTEEKDRPGRVIFLIITDGCENASREFSPKQVKTMIKEQTDKYNWLFVYLGANQDAFAEAGNLGILTARNFAANSVGTHALYDSLSRGVSDYRGGRGYGN